MGSFYGGAAPIDVALAAVIPPSEGVAGSAGTMSTAARGDHAHARLTSATTNTLDSNGSATITFTRSFTVPPAVTCLLVEAGAAQPVIFKVSSWIMTGALYTGCVIGGQRASILPSLSGIALLSGIITALSNFNVFGGSAAGAVFSCIAIQPSA